MIRGMVNRRRFLFIACLSIALPAASARAADDLTVKNGNIFRVSGNASSTVNRYENVSITTGGSILVQIVQSRTVDAYQLPVVQPADQGELEINGNLSLNNGLLHIHTGYSTANYSTEPETKNITHVSPAGGSVEFRSSTSAVSLVSSTLQVDGVLKGSTTLNAPTLAMDDSILTVNGTATFKAIAATNSIVNVGANAYTLYKMADSEGNREETYGVWGGHLTGTQVDLQNTDLNLAIGTLKVNDGLNITSGNVSLQGGMLDAAGKDVALTHVNLTSSALAVPYSNPFNAGGFLPAPTTGGDDGNMFIFLSTIKGANFTLTDTTMDLAHTILTATGAFSLNAASSVSLSDETKMTANSFALADGAKLSLASGSELTVSTGNLAINPDSSLSVQDSILRLTGDGATLTATGALSLSNASITGAVSVSNQYGQNTRLRLDGINTISGALSASNRVNLVMSGVDGVAPVLNVASLTVCGVSGDLCSISLSNGTINAGAGTVRFNAGTAISLHVGATDYGHIQAGTIINNTARALMIFVEAGALPNAGDSREYTLFQASTITNSFNLAPNARYDIEYLGAGKYRITALTDSEAMADTSVYDTYNAWLFMATPSATSPAGVMQLALNDLSQTPGSEMALNKALNDLQPDSSPLVVSFVTDLNRQLFKSVGTQLEPTRNNSRMPRRALWVEPLYTQSTYTGDKEFEMKTKGLVAGLETNINGVVWGLGYAYADGTGTMLERDMDVVSHTGMLYAKSAYDRQSVYWKAMATFGRSTWKGSGSVLGMPVSSEHDADTLGAQLLIGYNLGFKRLTGRYRLGSIMPEFGVRYNHVKAEKYTDSIEQTVDAVDARVLTGTAGLHYTMNYPFARSFLFYPDIRVGVVYDVIQKNPDLVVTLPNTASYPIETDMLDPFGVEADVELGFRMAHRVDLSVRYTGQWRSSYESHAGQLTLKVRF